MCEILTKLWHFVHRQFFEVRLQYGVGRLCIHLLPEFSSNQVKILC